MRSQSRQTCPYQCQSHQDQSSGHHFEHLLRHLSTDEVEGEKKEVVKVTLAVAEG